MPIYTDTHAKQCCLGFSHPAYASHQSIHILHLKKKKKRALTLDGH